MDNRYQSVSGIVIKDNKVLLVRQNYGSAKGLLIIPGGYLNEGEMPEEALRREIYEETAIVSEPKSLVAIRYNRKNWWAIFLADYISGIPKSDNHENTEAIFLDIEAALLRDDLTYTTKEILAQYKEGMVMNKLDFSPKGILPEDYSLYMYKD